MQKRGIGHLEFIMSMLIFISFIAAALFFFNPAQSNRLVSSSLMYTGDEIIKYSEVKLTSYSVNFPDGSALNGAFSIDILGAAEGGAIATDSKGNSVPAKKSTEGTQVELSGDGTNRFFTVMVSEGIVPSVPNAAFAIEYELATIGQRKVISESAIQDLKDRYNNGEYEYLKGEEEFNLPSRVDFSFALVFSAEDKIEAGMNRQIPSGLEAFSEVRRTEVLRNAGAEVTTEFADLLIRIW